MPSQARKYASSMKSSSSASEGGESESEGSSGKYAKALEGAYKPKVAAPLATPGKYSKSFGNPDKAAAPKKDSAYAASLSGKPFKGMY